MNPEFSENYDEPEYMDEGEEEIEEEQSEEEQSEEDQSEEDQREEEQSEGEEVTTEGNDPEKEPDQLDNDKGVFSDFDLKCKEECIRLLDEVLIKLPEVDNIPYKERLSLFKCTCCPSDFITIDIVLERIRSHRNLREMTMEAREILTLEKEKQKTVEFSAMKVEFEKMKEELRMMNEEFVKQEELRKIKEEKYKNRKEKKIKLLEENRLKEELKMREEYKMAEELKMLKEELANVKKKLTKMSRIDDRVQQRERTPPEHREEVQVGVREEPEEDIQLKKPPEAHQASKWSYGSHNVEMGRINTPGSPALSVDNYSVHSAGNTPQFEYPSQPGSPRSPIQEAASDYEPRSSSSSSARKSRFTQTHESGEAKRENRPRSSKENKKSRHRDSERFSKPMAPPLRTTYEYFCRYVYKGSKHQRDSAWKMTTHRQRQEFLEEMRQLGGQTKPRVVKWR